MNVRFGVPYVKAFTRETAVGLDGDEEKDVGLVVGVGVEKGTDLVVGVETFVCFVGVDFVTLVCG